MSLCPNYCECKSCEHGIKACDVTGCWDCRAIYMRAMAQHQHEESVRRQKAKLKVLVTPVELQTNGETRDAEPSA